jgi:hypothetical protein
MARVNRLQQATAAIRQLAVPSLDPLAAVVDLVAGPVAQAEAPGLDVADVPALAIDHFQRPLLAGHAVLVRIDGLAGLASLAGMLVPIRHGAAWAAAVRAASARAAKATVEYLLVVRRQ